MSSYSDKTNVYALFLLESLGFIYLNTGQLEQSRQIAQVLLQGATRNRLAIMKNWGDYYLGVVCYHRNELEAAAQHFTQIVENRYTGPDNCLSRCHRRPGVDPPDPRGAF